MSEQSEAEFDLGLEKFLRELSEEDVKALGAAQKTYGNSWRKRGGIGAFMMLARKWDRIENVVQQAQQTHPQYDIFLAAQQQARGDLLPDSAQRGGILEDVKDLRRYLLLVETYVRFNTAKRAADPTWEA